LSEIREVDAVGLFGEFQPYGEYFLHRTKPVRLSFMYDRVLAERLDEKRHGTLADGFLVLAVVAFKAHEELEKVYLEVILKVHLNEFEVGNVLELVAHDVWIVV
tara:strand:+ start:294 stop:605 length:312 start_codon:yes stop_codon:yes gene_type:complete